MTSAQLRALLSAIEAAPNGTSPFVAERPAYAPDVHDGVFTGTVYRGNSAVYPEAVNLFGREPRALAIVRAACALLTEAPALLAAIENCERLLEGAVQMWARRDESAEGRSWLREVEALPGDTSGRLASERDAWETRARALADALLDLRSHLHVERERNEHGIVPDRAPVKARATIAPEAWSRIAKGLKLAADIGRPTALLAEAPPSYAVGDRVFLPERRYSGIITKVIPNHAGPGKHRYYGSFVVPNPFAAAWGAYEDEMLSDLPRAGDEGKVGG